jgi:hypothetical protein
MLKKWGKAVKTGQKAHQTIGITTDTSKNA